MPIVTIEEARNKLSELIHRLTPGDEVVITENDQPVARLVPTTPTPTRKPRQFGTLKGRCFRWNTSTIRWRISRSTCDAAAARFAHVDLVRRPTESDHVGSYDGDGRPHK